MYSPKQNDFDTNLTVGKQKNYKKKDKVARKTIISLDKTQQ